MRRYVLSLVLSLALIGAPEGAPAQESHVLGTEDLDALVRARADELEADRATLRAFLARPEVRRAVRDAGLDIGRAETAVAALGPAEAADLAGRVEGLDAALAGGDRIVISTTAIIVGLLVLILILVA